jgi:hypothetical protein
MMPSSPESPELRLGRRSLATQQSRYIHQGARKGSSSRCSLSFSSSPWRPRDGGLSMWGVGSRSPAPWPAREIELLALATLAALAQISTPSAAHFLKSHQKKFAADRDRQKSRVSLSSTTGPRPLSAGRSWIEPFLAWLIIIEFGATSRPVHCMERVEFAILRSDCEDLLS